ncbi:MAG: hypothetical protein ACK5UC_11090, partial [Planctomycetaceae bacterium]
RACQRDLVRSAHSLRFSRHRPPARDWAERGGRMQSLAEAVSRDAGGGAWVDGRPLGCARPSRLEHPFLEGACTRSPEGLVTDSLRTGRIAGECPACAGPAATRPSVDGAPGLTGDFPNQHARAATANTTATPRRSPAPKPGCRAGRAVSRSGELRGHAVTANDALTRDDSVMNRFPFDGEFDNTSIPSQDPFHELGKNV